MSCKTDEREREAFQAATGKCANGARSYSVSGFSQQIMAAVMYQFVNSNLDSRRAVILLATVVLQVRVEGDYCKLMSILHIIAITCIHSPIHSLEDVRLTSSFKLLNIPSRIGVESLLASQPMESMKLSYGARAYEFRTVGGSTTMCEALVCEALVLMA